ncbi:hypothetical protein [Ectopseudomonas guguanensis]|uniref:hypothetical protein n=2 Tax=Ectopseudomonas guguanensis TaxID=1198456 RepID=UPI0012D6C4B8|nr:MULTISPECIES: hypothetical protein [Pseudomonas]MPT17077.1 hypothetical protein [Pseudomonas sp.]
MGSALEAVIGNPPGESKAMVDFAPEKIPLENFLFLERKHEICHFLIHALPMGELQAGSQNCSKPAQRQGKARCDGAPGHFLKSVLER